MGGHINPFYCLLIYWLLILLPLFECQADSPSYFNYWGYCYYCHYCLWHFWGTLHYTTVWCLATPSTMVCSWFTATRWTVPCETTLRRLDLVMIRPPGIDNGAFVVTPDSVWYARVLLLFSASAQTDTGSKSFDCALVSTLETYEDPENGNYWYYCHYCLYCIIFVLFNIAIIVIMEVITII
jgi:hypothetical protein